MKVDTHEPEGDRYRGPEAQEFSVGLACRLLKSIRAKREYDPWSSAEDSFEAM